MATRTELITAAQTIKNFGGLSLNNWAILKLNQVFEKNKQMFQWKDFIFPYSIKSFDYTSSAKTATYEYAMRDGAEHERVRNYRVFKISGVFATQYDQNGNQTGESALYYAKKLLAMENNEAGILVHKDFGQFYCIMKDLRITQTGEEEQVWNTDRDPCFNFDIEFWEQLSTNINDIMTLTKRLMPAPETKPISDYYESTLVYKSSEELFDAIKAGTITPTATDPIWIKYDIGMRTRAYDMWTRYLAGESTVLVMDNTSDKWYQVKAQETGIKIAKALNIAFTELWKENRGVKIRNQERGTESYYWKSPHKLWAGDRLKLPSS